MRHPALCRSAAREAALGEHFNEEQIVELVFVVATANWTNRVNDGLQTPLS
jgi:alkylhydroperoxidase family enzyme